MHMNLCFISFITTQYQDTHYIEMLENDILRTIALDQGSQTQIYSMAE